MRQSFRHYSIGLSAIIIFTFSEQSFAQLDFYSSSGYSNFINTMISNSIWQSSMESYTKQQTTNSHNPKKDSSRASKPVVVPAYRKYPAVQFKSTGTQLTLQAYLDLIEISQPEKDSLKVLILKIFKEYEAAAVAKGYPNDWALAYVSFVGLNNHVYYGKTEKPIIPFEQNIGLRDVVAENATSYGIFNGVTDQKKQELYELLVVLGGLTSHYYEKACNENNVEEIKSCKHSAEQNLQLVGIKPQ